MKVLQALRSCNCKLVWAAGEVVRVTRRWIGRSLNPQDGELCLLAKSGETLMEARSVRHTWVCRGGRLIETSTCDGSINLPPLPTYDEGFARQYRNLPLFRHLLHVWNESEDIWRISEDKKVQRRDQVVSLSRPAYLWYVLSELGC